MKGCIVFCFGLLAAQAAVASGRPAPEVLQAEQSRVATIATAAQTAVAVVDRRGTGGGSAVVISPDGYALTNFHVVQPVGHALKCGMADGRLYDAVLVGIDPTGDVALIKLFGRDDFPHATMGDSNALRVGHWVFAAGNPFLLASDFQPTITWGIVSGVHRYQYPSDTLLEYTDCIQTDAAINPGNSGGPLFDDEGRLVGVVGRASFEKRGRVNVGVGYAISINQIKHFMGYLRSGRIVDHASLGFTVATDDQGRVVVDEILETSDAYRRGLRYDDEIVHFGGREIGSVNALKNVLGIYPQGWRIPLTYRREGQTMRCIVRLARLHTEGQLTTMIQGRTPPARRGRKPKEPEHDLPSKLLSQIKGPRIPQVVTDHFEERRGYANYYFNKWHRDRVGNAYAARCGATEAGSHWTIRGQLPDGGEVTVHVGPAAGSILLPEGEWKVAFPQALRSTPRPPGSGGLLVALSMWQRLIESVPTYEGFGDVYYLGTLPLEDQQPWVDALVGTHAGVETRFFFDPASGDLVGLETFLDEESDPCEISLSDFREVNGRVWPHHLLVRHGDSVYAELTVTQIELSDSEETP